MLYLDVIPIDVRQYRHQTRIQKREERLLERARIRAKLKAERLRRKQERQARKERKRAEKQQNTSLNSNNHINNSHFNIEPSNANYTMATVVQSPVQTAGYDSNNVNSGMLFESIIIVAVALSICFGSIVLYRKKQ